VALKTLAAFLLLLVTACSGRQSGGSAAGNDSLSRERADGPRSLPAVAVRLPAHGGAVRAYRLPGLAPQNWESGGRVSPARAVIGVDVPGRRLLYRDSAGAIDAFDLVASLQKTVTPRGRFAALATDGTFLVITPDGAVTESQPWGSQRWPGTVGGGVRDAFVGLGSRLIVVRRDSLALLSREAGPPLTAPVPDAAALAASRDGDAIAFATDSGIVVVEDRDLWRSWFVPLTGTPTAVAFAPSGYRIYVALHAKSELEVLDRFQRKERPAIPLPGPAADLRMDPWGRVVLVRPAGQSDEVWVVGVASGRVAGRLRTRWASDLPTASENGVLLTKEGQAVVARDVRSLDSLGAVADGAGDLWFVGRWKPASAAVAARQEARRMDTVAVRAAPALSRRPAPRVVASAPAPAPTPAPTATPAPAAARRPAPAGAQPAPSAPVAAERAPVVWVQVSASQNERPARDLATELTHAGYRARVASPASPAESWRVLIGPFTTRTAADSVARGLGRPYWITGRGPAEAARP
jgi:cell division septation protein DedD